LHSPRGGLLTFHGPGQLTAYPILHLKTYGLTVRSYICLLEQTIIRVLSQYGVEGFTRPEYPGVWVSPTQKLASVGVHVQRGVTCFGTGLNVSTERKWWDRFSACGIEGVDMVGLTSLGVRNLEGREGERVVGEVLAAELVNALNGVEGVERVSEGHNKVLLKLAEERERLAWHEQEGNGEINA
jgi:lipoyl(octanoyl) transferase 2